MKKSIENFLYLQLNREELKNIVGSARAWAQCGPAEGDRVECEGNACTSTDYKGCQCDGNLVKKDCPVA
jgi:hypothetical protein